MIKANISPLHEAFFRPYIRGLLKKQFNAIHLLGEVPDFGDRCTLLLPNHSTWWDGFFVYLLKIKLFKKSTYLMMLEEQLSKNRFFSHVGVYSIDVKSVTGTLQSLKYTQQLLKRRDHPFVCVFPQGVLSPWGKRPLQYKRGINLVLRQLRVPINVCQVAFKCEYLEKQRADVFVRFGESLVVQPGESPDLSMLQSHHETLLEELNQQIINEKTGRLLLRGKRSINESFERLRQKLGLMRKSQ